MRVTHPILLLFPLMLLAACAHVTNNTGDTGPSKYHAWKAAPGVPIQEALAKAMESPQIRNADLSKGYVLEVSRGSYPGRSDYWWFQFQLLPASPDYEIIVRVYDSGQVE